MIASFDDGPGYRVKVDLHRWERRQMRLWAYWYRASVSGGLYVGGPLEQAKLWRDASLGQGVFREMLWTAPAGDWQQLVSL